MDGNELPPNKRRIWGKIDQICGILDSKVRNNPNDEGYNRLMDKLEQYREELLKED